MTEQTTQIAEFNKTETALVVLREKYTTVPDCTNKEGYEECRQGIAELRTLRTGLDKARKGLNADDQARIKFRNDEAKRITGELVSLEDPLKAAKFDIDEKAEREAEAARKVEEERIAEIHAHMGLMTSIRSAHAGMTVATLSRFIDDNRTAYNDFDWQEFKEAALAEHDRIHNHLALVLQERKAFDAEQADLEEKKKAMAEEQAKLDAQKKAQDEELAKQKAELDAQQRKVDEERQEAARVMQAAQDKAEAEKRRQEAEKAAKEREEAEKAEAVKQEAKRLEFEKIDAARQESLKPDKEKLKDWFAKVRFIDAPAGLKSKEAAEMASEFMADLDNLASKYIVGLEEL